MLQLMRIGWIMSHATGSKDFPKEKISAVLNGEVPVVLSFLTTGFPSALLVGLVGNNNDDTPDRNKLPAFSCIYENVALIFFFLFVASSLDT